MRRKQFYAYGSVGYGHVPPLSTSDHRIIVLIISSVLEYRYEQSPIYSQT